MDHSLEIEKVLASLSAQGAYQSSGEFSLDPLKAAQRLQSQSLFAEYWIVRWIQGNVLAGATRIEGGTDEILRNIIAERVLGLPADVRVDKDVAFKDVPKGA